MEQPNNLMNEWEKNLAAETPAPPPAEPKPVDEDDPAIVVAAAAKEIRARGKEVGLKPFRRMVSTYATVFKEGVIDLLDSLEGKKGKS